MDNNNNNLIKQFRYQLTCFYFLRYLLLSLIFLAFAGGIAVLTIRVLLCRSITQQTASYYCLGAIILIVLFSLYRSFLKIPSVMALRPAFDRINHCGGLLMTSSETEIGKWSKYISEIKAPQIKWKNGNQGGLLFLAICFLVFSFLVPQRYITSVQAHKLEIDDQTNQIQQQIQVLQEEEILPEEAANDLRDKLKEIEENAQGREPVKTWEALGHLQDQLKKAADEASVGILAETEDLTKTETLAQALSQLEDQMDQLTMDQALSELAQLAQGMLKKNPKLCEKLQENLLNSAEAGKLNSEQLKELLKALQDRKLNLSECMGRLCEANLSDLKMLKMCENACKCNGEGLAKLLGECPGNSECMTAIEMYCNNSGWGISRGRGDAPMIWGDPSSEEGVSFKEQALPPSSFQSLSDAELVGVSISAPSVEEGYDNLLNGSLNNAAAGSAQAVQRTVLPKHQRAVKGYFNRKNNDD